MKSKHRVRWSEVVWVATIAAFALGLGGGAALGQARPEPVTLNYAWLPEGYHAYMFLAHARGYYREHGVDVTLKQGKGSAATLPLVAQGNQDFGFIDATVVLKGIGAGMPISMIALLQQKSPFTLLTLEEMGINSLKDFEGKSIADVPGGACQQHMRTLLTVNGVDVRKIRWRVTNPEAQLNLLVTRATEGFCGWITGQQVTLEKRGIKEGFRPKGFLYADYGINLISSGLVTNETMIRRRPAVVRGVVQGTLKGLAEAEKNPQEAIRAMQRAFPEIEFDVELAKLEKTFVLTRSTLTQQHCPGWQTLGQWQELLKRNKEVGAVTTDIDVSKAFTNEFLPCR